MLELKIKTLDSFIQKSIGLLTAKKAYPILFKTRFGIHTFGMRFPIDVIILDSEYKVVRLVENLKPYRIFLWPPKFNMVIELPAGEIRLKGVKLGVKLQLISNPI